MDEQFRKKLIFSGYFLQINKKKVEINEQNLSQAFWPLETSNQNQTHETNHFFLFGRSTVVS